MVSEAVLESVVVSRLIEKVVIDENAGANVQARDALKIEEWKNFEITMLKFWQLHIYTELIRKRERNRACMCVRMFPMIDSRLPRLNSK